MPIKKPYYALHQIISGQYTPGNEYVLDDGSDYIGSFHVLPNEQIFTDNIPTHKSVELYIKRSDMTDTVRRYNGLVDAKVSKYISPVPYQPIPTADEYSKGTIQRFFVQKRNSSSNTITEIDFQQFNSINVSNFPGINGGIWNSLLLPWKISRIPAKDIQEINRRALIRSEVNFPGIGLFITNLLEFHR